MMNISDSPLGFWPGRYIKQGLSVSLINYKFV